VDIPNDKPVWIALTYIHGIGKFQAAGFSRKPVSRKAFRANKLTEDEVSKINQLVDRDHVVEVSFAAVSQHIARSRKLAAIAVFAIGGVFRSRPAYAEQRPNPQGKRKTVAGKKASRNA